MRVVRSERGSLPVVMLAVLVVGSLVTVLVGTVVSGQRQTRFDQSFEQALQVAETGLERMIYLIRSRQKTADFSLGETVVPTGRYSGAADKTGTEWQLTAAGVAPGGTLEGAASGECPTLSQASSTAGNRERLPCRSVTVKVTMESLFGVAAYGRTLVELRGTNTADSYDSRRTMTGGPLTRPSGGSTICRGSVAANPFASSDTAETRMCSPTNNGVVATNGELYLLGGVIAEVDRAQVHYAREQVTFPLAGATGFCGGVTETCQSSKLRFVREPIELEPDPVVPPSDLTNQGSFSGTTLPAGRQLYTNMTLDRNTVIAGTPANPTIVYLTGTLTVPNGEVVNFTNFNGLSVPKPAPGLLIFSAGVGPALRFGNHASFAGAVYAPRATFSGGAAGNIYGSIVTGSISTQGSWNFHYDDALGAVETEAKAVLSGWAER